MIDCRCNIILIIIETLSCYMYMYTDALVYLVAPVKNFFLSEELGL